MQGEVCRPGSHYLAVYLEVGDPVEIDSHVSRGPPSGAGPTDETTARQRHEQAESSREASIVSEGNDYAAVVTGYWEVISQTA